MRDTPNATGGFTLVELMIVVAIIAILSAIGYPAYTDYVYKSRRSEGTSTLLDLAGRMERYYADNNTYTGATVAGLLGSASTEHGHYTVSFKALSANAYTLQAERAGKQADDKCGTYTITSLAAKGVESGSLAKAKCW